MKMILFKLICSSIMFVSIWVLIGFLIYASFDPNISENDQGGFIVGIMFLIVFMHPFAYAFLKNDYYNFKEYKLNN